MEKIRIARFLRKCGGTYYRYLQGGTVLEVFNLRTARKRHYQIGTERVWLIPINVSPELYRKAMRTIWNCQKVSSTAILKHRKEHYGI